MLTTFLSKYIEIHKNYIELYGEKEGEKSFKSFTNLIEFLMRMRSINSELDLYEKVYINEIFPITEKHYKSSLKREYNSGEKEIIKVVNEIVESPKHKPSDEVTLLFYVGLYHKIENYESEILNHYNIINHTNFKKLNKIGIDTHNKKQLFSDIDRIRLITNSIKHNQFYPKNELLKYYPNLKPDKKISLDDFNPKEDIFLVKSFLSYFNLLISLKNRITANEQIFGKNIDLDKSFLELTKDENIKKEDYKSSYLKK
ncbi:hypothetical protein [Polaribacter sp. 11A2H]|uniref:hypothetical protein n=1 Tax=Polaribacter sp. 11A2H TaxID=2687290 RepID=UPI00140CD99C|nr:hypothetical protein [Polaribacter sp. 11A2H]